MMLAPMKPPYDNIRQAYNHLLILDGIQPYERRAKRNWVLVYFDRSMSFRLFPTLEAPGKWYSWSIYQTNTFVTPEHLSARFTSNRLWEIYNKLSGHGLAPEFAKQGLQTAKLLWELFQEIGDRVDLIEGQGQGTAQDDDKYHVKIERLKEPEAQIILKALPKQAQIIASCLAEAEKTSYTEAELSTFARNLVISGKLKTKQDSVRVVKYYAPALADLDFMHYKGKRV